MFYGVENRYLEGWQRFAIGVNPGTPAAGNRAAVRIRMPAGSGVIAVLARISVFKGGAASSPVLLYDSIATPMPTQNVVTPGARSLDTRHQQPNDNPIVSEHVNL